MRGPEDPDLSIGASVGGSVSNPRSPMTNGPTIGMIRATINGLSHGRGRHRGVEQLP